MNNTDKHRLLLVTVIKPFVYTTIGPDFKGTIQTVGAPYIPGSSSVSGHVNAPLITGSLAEGAEMDVQFQSATALAFKKVGTRQGEPVIEMLGLHLALSARDGAETGRFPSPSMEYLSKKKRISLRSWRLRVRPPFA